MALNNQRPKGLPNNPFVSVVTPTYNRRRFIPYLIECYKSQTYPKERMEWIIYDDGTEPVKDLFENLKLPNIRYIYEEEKQNIGAKRIYLLLFLKTGKELFQNYSIYRLHMMTHKTPSLKF